MHEGLRQVKLPEKSKPIFIAGLLIALQSQSFTKEYSSSTTFKSLYERIESSIKDVLSGSDIRPDKIDYIVNSFKVINSSEKLKAIPLSNYNSLMWYLEQLELKIKPMMDIADTTLDALSVFYHEFVKYSGGDGSGLGIVLTPQHLTEFMCDLVEVNKNSRVVDICCGSGSFLVTSMSKMVKQANLNEIKKIKQHGLYGVELDPELFTLAVANMIVRRDGKSNIINDDCFKQCVVDELKSYNVNIGLMNPPYSQDDHCELEFAEQLLDILVPGGKAAIVVPMSCAIGTKFKEVRERLFNNHTLKAVFSMPDDIFYPTATNVCVMLWEAHTPHNSENETFFGYYKDDGFEKRKKLGRVDVHDTWVEIEKKWLSLYRKHEVVTGLSAVHCVTYKQEWLCEAYMKTDYTKLTQDDFQASINDYLAYLIQSEGGK